MTSNDTLVEELRFLETNKSFLGREFLTWLWYLSESNKHKVALEHLGEFTFYVDDKLVLSSSDGAVRENSLKGGTPGYAQEAKLALVGGKLVHEAKFILQDVERQWMWTMRSDSLLFKAVALPPTQDPDPAGRMLERMKYMQLLVEFVESLYKRFLARRLSPTFGDELRAMGEWMQPA